MPAGHSELQVLCEMKHFKTSHNCKSSYQATKHNVLVHHVTSKGSILLHYVHMLLEILQSESATKANLGFLKFAVNKMNLLLMWQS